jgi:hypothetical protein
MRAHEHVHCIDARCSVEASWEATRLTAVDHSREAVTLEKECIAGAHVYSSKSVRHTYPRWCRSLPAVNVYAVGAGDFAFRTGVVAHSRATLLKSEIRFERHQPRRLALEKLHLSPSVVMMAYIAGKSDGCDRNAGLQDPEGRIEAGAWLL